MGPRVRRGAKRVESRADGDKSGIGLGEYPRELQVDFTMLEMPRPRRTTGVD